MSKRAALSSTRRGRLMAAAQLAALLVFIAFSIAFIRAIWGLGSSSRNYPTVVLAIGIVVAAFGVSVVIRDIRRGRDAFVSSADKDPVDAAAPPSVPDAGAGPRHPHLVVTASIVLIVALVEATQRWGLLPSVVIYAPLQMLVMGDRTWWRLVGAAVAIPLAIYLVLYRALLIPLP